VVLQWINPGTLIKQGSLRHAMPRKTERKPDESPAPEVERIVAHYSRNRVVTEATDAARLLFSQSGFGKPTDDGKVHLSLMDTLYLLEKGRLKVLDGREREIAFETLLKQERREEPQLWVRYSVFKNLRSRGYVVKTALKFGADFRVYDRGVKPGDDHARWVVYPVHESGSMTWHEFAAKNRVAHSTKKRLMLAIVDDEGDVTYYEVRWMRP